ncbi:MAG: PD-(D/E)XK nuclease family protein, partial [Candidatus Omnitrophica bacterium]|nr:PD-(D/E)XK nuclease family protein [Candidatus Omnitrophota bacterium]
ELIEEGFKKFLNKKPVIDKKFRKEFNSLFEDKFAQTIAKRMKSDSFLLKGIIQNRLKQFLDKETLREPAKIICLEEKFQGQIKLNGEVISFISKVDRIDQCSDGSISIIDYKTGGVGSIPKRLAQLEKMEFSRSSIKDNIKSFQLPLYYYLTRERFSGVCLNAELYSVRTLERKPFISQSDYLHKERIMEICLKALEFIFGELFDPNIPFEPDRQDRHCESCGFRCFC